VIGVCFDGTGYGTDGTIWGGEFLIADYVSFERAAHLKPLPLPGGDAATRRPARIALAYLLACGLDAPQATRAALTRVEQQVIARQVASGLNTPLTSSMGRLFDAVSALLGICHTATYEGQAAIELEAAVDPGEDGAYQFDLESGAVIEPGGVIAQIMNDLAAGIPVGRIAARFHNAVAQIIADVVARIAALHGLQEVALSGGVFQNVTLLDRTLSLLHAAGYEVLTHQLVPPNDGGLALGQAVIACARIKTPNTQYERLGSNNEVSR
jgi:hydrogenase maturation protein HypF